MAVFVFRGSCYTRFCEDMKQRERERERASPRVCFLSDHFNHVRRSWCLKGVGCRQWGNPDLQLLFYHLHLPQDGSWDSDLQQEPRFETPSSYHSSTCSREMSRTSLRSATSALWDVFHFFWMGCCVWLIQDTSEKGDPLSSGFHQVHLLIIS